jgi:hypothetical protein
MATAAFPIAEPVLDEKQFDSYREIRAGYSALDPYGVAARNPVGCELRPFPQEILYFPRVKEIDNSRVVRQTEPGMAETCWRFVTATALVAVVVVGLLAPNAYSVLNGFQLEQLKQRRLELEATRRTLAAETSSLTSPKRMHDLADKLGFIDPPMDRVIRLRGTEQEAVAAWSRIDRKPR